MELEVEVATTTSRPGTCTTCGRSTTTTWCTWSPSETDEQKRNFKARDRVFFALLKTGVALREK